MWRVEMLGNLCARADEVEISRFRTRRVGLLLAYLAYFQERNHSREELADMLWSECEPDLARRNLRQALSSLRHHLEPPSVPAGAALVAKQSRVSLNPELVTTDVAEFNRYLRAASNAGSSQRRFEALKQAVELYRGDFLPGYYEEWVQQERLRLEDLFVGAVQALTKLCESEGRIEEAIRYVNLALAKDQLQEDLHTSLMRLYLASDRPASALQHFQVWKEKLKTELGIEPGVDICQLAESARGHKARPPAGKFESPKPQALGLHSSSSDSDLPGTEARLPLQLTRFFGRSAERRRAIEDLTHGKRIVTLVGPAGTGKTRLSIEVGRTLAEQHGWNVWFVPLADISDGSTAFEAIVDSMKLQKEPASDTVRMLRSHVSGSKNLLILDNLEHIVESVVPVVETIAQELPGISMLTTSRQGLKIGGEHEIDLQALPIPDENVFHPAALADFAEVASVQLFVDRAQAIHPDFQVTANNAATIAAICSRLEGLPLALEIAASLCNAFTPSQLLKNLDSRLEILRSRRRDLTGRHRSLRAAIDYSYELLSPELQSFFAALSVFRGGFTVEAADRVCLAPKDQTFVQRQTECLRMILDLQERSLLRSEDALPNCPARFRLLESFREYGAERLDAEQAALLRQRHGNFFVELSGRTDRPMTMGGLDGEQENRLAALQLFCAQGAVPECVALLTALNRSSQTGRDVVITLTKSPDFEDFEPKNQLKLLRLLANGHIYASEFEEAYRIYKRSLVIATRFGVKEQIAACHRGIAANAGYLGRLEEALAEDYLCLELVTEIGDPAMIENAQIAVGNDLWSTGQFALAQELFELALATARTTSRGDGAWESLYNLARVRLDVGNLDDGMKLAGDGIRAAQVRRDEFGVSMCLSIIARYHRLRGNLLAAYATSREALIKRQKAGFDYWSLNGLQAHAVILVHMLRYREAITLLAATRDATKLNRAPDDREFTEGIDTVRANLSGAEFEQAWAEGLTMNVEEAFRLALCKT